MSETVKIIIEIPKATYEDLKLGKIYSSLCEAPQGLVEGIRNGIPLDNNSERAEVQAYFAGQTYGWEEGRKDLCDKISAKIKQIETAGQIDAHTGFVRTSEQVKKMALDVVEKYKAESEESE